MPPARPLGLAALALALVAGCAEKLTDVTGTEHLGAKSQAARVVDADIVAHSYQAAERLLRNARQPLDREKPILVASLVNVANMEQTSNLGRIVSEQMSSRLNQLGHHTREVKFRGSVLVTRGGGEFALSRMVREISDKQEAQAVLAGVYAVARNAVFITLRMIRAEDGAVIGAYDYALPLGPDTAALLGPYESYSAFEF
jgi:TolB-like protein